MLPFSENLPANSTYFNKVKESLANPTLGANFGNHNI
jgi:hypothetical protein